MISNCNRDFSNKNGVSQDAVYILGICFGIINGFSRFFWGWLVDIWGFKILMYIITIVEVIVSATLYFSVRNALIYVISILLIAMCLGCHFSILSPCFNKIFGLEIGPEIYGLTGNFIGISSMIGPLMTKHIIDEKSDYLYAFLAGGTLCLMKIFVLLVFDENEKYVYEKKNVIEMSSKKIAEEEV